MRKYKQKITSLVRKFLIKEILEIRRKRSVFFTFLSLETKVTDLAYLLKLELTNKLEKADNFIINLAINDLVNKKILAKECLVFNSYKLEKLTYWDVFFYTIDNEQYCRGTSTDKNEAFARAIGEVFERTSLQYPTLEEIREKQIENTWGKAKLNLEQFLNIETYPQPTEKQKEKFKLNLTDDCNFNWTKVNCFFSNKEIFIPSRSIFWKQESNLKELNISETNTSGGGCGINEFEAMKSATFEIIHRHFFFKNWFQRKTPNKIKIDSIPNNSKLYEKIKDLEKRGFKINILDYTKESNIPTNIVIIEKFDGIYTGGATNWQLEDSIEKALDEAVSTYLWVSKTIHSGKNSINQDFISNIKNDFLEEKMSVFYKILLFSNKSFWDKFTKENGNFPLGGEFVNFQEIRKYDILKENRNLQAIKLIVKKIFGKNAYFFKKNNSYLTDYNSSTFKVFIPNAYHFALNEKNVKPVVDNKLPIYTEINPFP